MIKKFKKIFLIVFVALSFIMTFNMTFNILAASTTKKESLEKMTRDLNDLSDKIEDLQAKNSELKIKLDSAKISYFMKFDDAKRKIKHIYENSNESIISDVLEKSNNLSQLSSKYSYIATIVEQDGDTLKTLKKSYDNVLKRQKQLDKSEADLKKTKVDLQSEVNELSAKIKKEEEEKVNRIVSKAGISPQVLTAAQDAVLRAGAINIQTETSATTSEIIYLAAVLEREAGSANYEAELAVATVVMNRVNHPSFPNSIIEVLTQRGQFDGAAAEEALQRILARGPATQCIQAAQDAVNGCRCAAIGNAIYFWSDWYAAQKGRSGVNIGGNVFFE